MSQAARQNETFHHVFLLFVGLTLATSFPACQHAAPSPPPSVFEGVPLIDQDGREVPGSALSHQTLLVNFMFTSCPVVCPRQTQALAEVRAALPPAVRERVRFVSVSVDPENDTPSALKRFAQLHHADDSGWSFVRSDTASTQLLTTRLAAFQPGDEPAPSSHGTTLYLFDRGGRLAQRYRGAPLDVSHLARELTLLDDVKPSEARVARN